MREKAGELIERARERGWGGQVLVDEPLSRHTSYRIGGPADLYVIARKEEELLGWIALAREANLPYLVIGRGTNLLVADGGIKGMVVENRCPGVYQQGQDSEIYLLRAQGGVSLPSLARHTAQEGWGGLEWAVGIPGSIGGAVVNNAGAYGSSVAETLRGVTILNEDGHIKKASAADLRLGYRTSRFRQGDKGVILEVEFELHRHSPALLLERVTSYQLQRRKSQPIEPCAGSVFKNPPGESAARLIEASGLKGARVGDAQVSPLHANYIVNLGQARASDVAALISLIGEKVWREHKVELELEIELVGRWEEGKV